MTPGNAVNWYPIEQIAEATGASIRTLRRRLSDIPTNNMRLDVSAGGRPRTLFHYESLPELSVEHRRRLGLPSSSSVPSESSVVPSLAPCVVPPPKARGHSKDDLVRAELRLRAIHEFEERCKLLNKEQAAEATCRDWAHRTRCQTVQMSERLPGGHSRVTRENVSLGIFKPGTLRTWAGTYARTKNVLSLVDRKKGSVGRKETAIPPALLSYIYGLCVSTARADVAKAVAWGEKHWPGPEPFTQTSIATWRRRIKAFDPRHAGKDLMHSVQRYRANQTPDVEVDWNALPYNGRFEVDDVQQDWYGLASDMERFIRPYAYAVLRARTRQWIAFVCTETAIIDAQVAELIGFTMAQPTGGIPDLWKLENRNVTTTGDIVAIIESLGSKVSHTSMDGGTMVIPGAVKDGADGHPQGHALIERANRDLHEIAWNAPAQVGGDERRTSPSRTEAFLRMAREAQKRGEVVLVHGPEQWAARMSAVAEHHNNTPNSGLEQIIDPDTGKVRHMTPNECAKMLGSQEVKVMPAEMLPLFATRGEFVPVTRNGIRINNRSYGRFDEALKAYPRVKAYVSDMSPDIAYVHELGRCVDAYLKTAPGEWDQFAAKLRGQAHYKNQFAQVMAEAMASDSSMTLSAMMALKNPVPNRPETVVAPPELMERATRIQTAVAAHRDRAATMDKRFEVPTCPAVGLAEADPSTKNQEPRTKNRSGLLRRLGDLDDQLAVLGSSKQEDLEWKQSE